LSVSAEILRGIQKKIVLGLYRKKSFKNGQEIGFEFYAQKMAKNSPFLA
jgi:hypothetical protein